MVDTVRLPTTVEEGAEGGPRDQVQIQTAISGHEQRVSDWDEQRCEFDISYGVTSVADAQLVLKIYRSRGSFIPFRFRDPADHDVTGQALGTGDGSNAVFQAIKTYPDGVYTGSRTIRRLVSGTLLVYVNAVQKTETTHYTVDYDTGLITFTAGNEPPNGHAVTATFEFDNVVRFVDDAALRLRGLSGEDNFTIPSINLIELLDE